jgi:hypothetical protein
MKRAFRQHEVVVYEKTKHGPHPGPRARAVRPAPLGETYDYLVDKYWIVVASRTDGSLVLRTPGGKLHELRVADPCLRRPTLREKLWLHLAGAGRGRLRALRQPGGAGGPRPPDAPGARSA